MSHSSECPQDVSVHFASFNTSHVSELCIRSMHALADHPFQLFVGDCDSTDGSIEMFNRYKNAGWLQLEVAAGGRRHGEWLDQWLRNATTKYVVFCDSDIEFLRTGWLREMVQVAVASGAALVATRIQAVDGVAYVHPQTGAKATLAARPEPWLMMLDADQVRGAVHASFLYEEDLNQDGSKIAYDTAAAFFRELTAAKLTYVEMPVSFARSFRHYSGMTWQRTGVPLRRQVKQLAKRCYVDLRWIRSKVIHRTTTSN